MNHSAKNRTGQLWHSSDFLIRIVGGEELPESSMWVTDRVEASAAAEAKYGVVSLGLVATNPGLHERLTLARSSMFVDRDLVVFGARTKSNWALNVLVGRLTRFAHDWASFRDALHRSSKSENSAEPILDFLPLDRLYMIVELLHERNLDSEVERELLRHIAFRTEAGASFPEKKLEPLVERLLQAGLADHAQRVLPRLKNKSWERHAFTIELEHPRFGGSFDAMLGLLNEPYRRLGIEVVTLDAEAESPFHRLQAEPQAAAPAGPLVTVIMTCWCPGVEIFTAVRSIIHQTYQNWELIITDDASPVGVDVESVLEQVAALDPRIRIVRNDTNAGTYVRRNEAIQMAQGEFVTVQDSDDWSHPHRLEVQVGDLRENPTRLANTVHAARVTEEFSVISNRGARLFVAEPSLMFRREPVIAAVGYYDSIRKSADTEFRKRLEAATKRPIPALLPGAPLKLMLADSTSLSGADFGTNIWNHADRLTYWSATHRYLQRIQSGAHDPFLPFPQTLRAFHAPQAWSSGAQAPEEFDVIMVLDGRESAERADFHDTVAQELQTASASGLRVALLQSDSLTGPQRAMAFFPPALQAFVDSGAIARIGSGVGHTAKVVVVRHAGAAQGHPAERLEISTQRVVIVEDATGGDLRGATIAEADVNDTVSAWFDVTPSWTVALPALPTPTVTALKLNTARLQVTLQTGAPKSVRLVRLHNGERSIDLQIRVSGGDSVIATSTNTSVGEGEWTITADFDTGDGFVVDRQCVVGASAVIWNDPDQIAVRTEAGAIRVVIPSSDPAATANREFVADYLSTGVRSVKVVGEGVELTVLDEGASSLAAIYGLREVDNSVVRRRDFVQSASTDGRRTWERKLTKFADSRWQLFGTFRTPLGAVEFPVTLNSTAELLGTEAWQPQVLSGGRLLIASPPAGKLISVSRRIARGVDSQIGSRVRQLARRAARNVDCDGHSSSGKVHFDSRHSASRQAAPPQLSVVMPVYNVEPYLDAAITAVLSQDFADLELIIVDDASTDRGDRIIAKHWRKDSRVRVFALNHNTIGGAGVPSNIGTRAARGTYVAFADSDDHVTKSGLASMVRLAEAHSAELVIGDFRTFTEKLKEGAVPYDRAVWDELPLNRSISVITHPALFRLSPVPWRKLYRRDFIETHGVLFPEGDYFYEDNPLHWFALSRAHQVVVTDEVISFHRMEREGQTMSAQSYKLGAFVNHANTILNFLTEGPEENRNVLIESFFGYLDRSHWTVKNQTQPAAAALLRRGLGDVFQKAINVAPTVPVPPLVRPRLVTYGSAYEDVDLSIVIPVFNSADLLKETLDSVLSMTGIKFNVLIVDDGSTDDSLAVLRRYENEHENVHVFSQGNRGAGRARNSIIPLCTGRYTYFLDADDLIDAAALAAAVRQADADSADLLFVKYRIEFADEGRSQGMFTSDRDLWSSLAAASGNDDRQRIVARLINYPWNRIIRTSLLHDANIFFGPTIVHNDVLFHWHSIVSAERISYLDAEVCVHRKFATREQVTNIADARRLAVLDALRATHQRIVLLDSYPNVQNEWSSFASHLIEWAASRIPAPLQPTYVARSADLRLEMGLAKALETSV